MFKEAEFWVGVSFFIFVGILIWKGVPGMITSALDARAEKIKNQLEDIWYCHEKRR